MYMPNFVFRFDHCANRVARLLHSFKWELSVGENPKGLDMSEKIVSQF
jgi:hypothetical protein